MRQRERQLAKKIALRRILKLLSIIRKTPEDVWIRRYSQLARRIAMRLRLKVPMPFRKFYCKNCGTFRFPGKDLSVRIRKGKVVYICKVCGKKWVKRL